MTSWVGTRWMPIVLTIGLLGLAGGAAADSHETEEPAAAGEQTGETAVSPSEEAASPTSTIPPPHTYEPMMGVSMADRERYPDLDVPSEAWAYDTKYFFAATRGLYEGDPSPVTKELSDVEKGFSMIGTIPVDIVALPGAALAGLWGS